MLEHPATLAECAPMVLGDFRFDGAILGGICGARFGRGGAVFGGLLGAAVGGGQNPDKWI